MNIINTMAGDSAKASSKNERIRSPHRMMTWQAVQSEVLSRIRNGYWRPGDLIPTETELAAEFGCARATINRALTTLAANGLLERRRKVGTRVAQHLPERSMLSQSGLREEIEAGGAAYGYRLVAMRETVPPLVVTQGLMLPRDATVVELHAAFMADDKLYCCEERWINPAAVPEIPAGAFDSLSPYEWLSQCVGMNHGRKSISSALPAELPPFVAAAFETARKTATLRIEQVLWADAVAVTMSRCYYPHGHSLEMDL